MHTGGYWWWDDMRGGPGDTRITEGPRLPRPSHVASFAALLALASLRAGVSQEPPASLPAEVESLLQAGRKALQSQDAGALRSIAEPDSLAWLGPRGFSGQPHWKLDILRLPAPTTPRPSDPSIPYLAIFHCYHTVQSIGDHVHRLVKAADGWRIGAEIPEGETLGFRVKDHRITARIEPKSSRCAFTDDAVVEGTGSSAGNLCLLRLSDVLTVDSLAIRSEGGAVAKPIEYATAPGCIALTAPPKTFTLALKYHGVYNATGQDSYINAKEASLTSYWWPNTARMPATLSVTATVPKGWIAEAQGEPKGTATAGGTTTYSFRNEIPVCYFTLDAAPYVVTTREIGGKRVSVYLLKANPGRAKVALDQFGRAVSFFGKAFARFPYTHYEMVETAGPFGGALEAYSFATYGPGAFNAVVHELSHTWWGGIVPNTYLHTMWNESFADYSDSLETRMTGEEAKTPALRNQHRAPDYGRRLLTSYAVPAMQAFDTSNGPHDAVGYGKGAEVMAMLEDLLGTDTMLKCMRRFIADHPKGEPGEWPEFERAVDRETGRDYGWFFEQWLNRGGVPVVGIANVKQVAGEVSFDVVQEGTPYRLRIPVAVEMQDGKTVRRTIEVRSLTESIRLSGLAGAKSATLDPDGSVLMAGRKTDDSTTNPFVGKL